MQYRKVYVVVFHSVGMPPAYYFCGNDKDRIIFFKEMKLDSLPSANLKESKQNHPMVVLIRDKQVIEAGSCEWINEENSSGIFFVSYGLDNTRRKAQEYDNKAHDLRILRADWFEEQDCLEIQKNDWGKVSWLSQVATSRMYGAKFNEVFPQNSSVWKMLPRCLFKKYVEFEEKTVIFDGQQPIITELKEFY